MENIRIYEMTCWRIKDEFINPNDNDIIYTVRIGHYEEFNGLYQIRVNISKDVYMKILNGEYNVIPSGNIVEPIVIFDNENNIIPMIKSSLNINSFKVKKKKY